MARGDGSRLTSRLLVYNCVGYGCHSILLAGWQTMSPTFITLPDMWVEGALHPRITFEFGLLIMVRAEARGGHPQHVGSR